MPRLVANEVTRWTACSFPGNPPANEPKSKRHRTAALQDLAGRGARNPSRQRFGVRLSSAAFRCICTNGLFRSLASCHSLRSCESPRVGAHTQNRFLKPLLTGRSRRLLTRRARRLFRFRWRGFLDLCVKRSRDEAFVFIRQADVNLARNPPIGGVAECNL